MQRYFKEFLIKHLFTPIVDWLKDRYKINVTVNDLISVVEGRGKRIKQNDDVVNYDDIEVYPGYYRDVVDVYLEVEHKFIIQKLQDGELIVIGIVGDNGHDRLLNENEIQIARGMGLNVFVCDD
jgi:hypothetical protein